MFATKTLLSPSLSLRLLWATLFLLTSPLHANEAAALTELHIQADQLSIDKQKQFSRYMGHVQMQYEDKHLTAEQVDLFFKDEALSKIIAYGADTPVKITMTNTLGNITGTAGKIIFLLIENKVELQHEALLLKNDDRFSGEFIQYDLNSHKITARKSPSSSEQVEMIIKAPSQPQ